jgi:transcriptional regulator GlxA family with amidase domain
VPVQTVAIVVYEGVQALDVAGPMDVFSEANAFVNNRDQYETVLVAPYHDPLRASNGIRLIADQTLEETSGRFDIILVAGSPTPPEAEPEPSLVRWVRELPRRSCIYGSICTGAFVLGYAGLLDDHRVTTHWQDVRALVARFPRARVEPDLIYVRDGRLITAAGVTAGIDLGLALVGQRRGDGAQDRQEAGGGCPAPGRTVAVQSLFDSTGRPSVANRAYPGPYHGPHPGPPYLGIACRCRWHEPWESGPALRAGGRHHTA